MANKILTPTTLWGDFDDSLPLNESLLNEKKTEHALLRTIRFYGRAVGNERVNIFARYGEPLGGGGKRPAILILPDSSLTADFSVVERFVAQGYCVLMPDYRGSWKGTDGYTMYPESVSYANVRISGRHFDHADESAKETSWYEWVAVARYGVQFLASLPQVGNIGAIGIRDGGDIVWQLAATCDKLSCVVPICAGGWQAYRGINKYGESFELKMDDERYRYIAGVESQSYAPYVKCPVLMLCSTNDERFDADRAFDTMARVNPSQEKTFYFAARYNGHIGNTGLNDLDLFLEKYLKGRAVFVPQPADVQIEEDVDGELVAKISFDRNGEVTYCEVYMAEDTCEAAVRDWVQCELKRREPDEQVFRLNTCRGASRVFAFAKAKYSCGFAVSSRIAMKRIEKAYSNQVDKCRILYSSLNGTDSFTLDRFDKNTLADCFLDNSVSPIFLMNGPYRIRGVASPYGLRFFRINDIRYRPSENALLKFDIFNPETTTVQITICAEKNGVNIKYVCNLFLAGCQCWTDHVLSAKDFKTEENKPLAKLSDAKYISFYSSNEFCLNNLLWL